MVGERNVSDSGGIGTDDGWGVGGHVTAGDDVTSVFDGDGKPPVDVGEAAVGWTTLAESNGAGAGPDRLEHPAATSTMLARVMPIPMHRLTALPSHRW
jgi:hypothetical protein